MHGFRPHSFSVGPKDGEEKIANLKSETFMNEKKHNIISYPKSCKTIKIYVRVTVSGKVLSSIKVNLKKRRAQDVQIRKGLITLHRPSRMGTFLPPPKKKGEKMKLIVKNGGKKRCTSLKSSRLPSPTRLRYYAWPQ